MKKLTIILTVLFMAATTGLFSQDLNDAGKAYNKGIELSKENDLIGAIESYSKCANICQDLGDVGEGLKVKAETQISSLYLKLGINAYKAKTLDTAISLFALSADYADMVGKPESAKKAKNYGAACHAAQGNALIKEKKYNDAIGKFKEATEINPEFFKAYYGLAICYSKTDSVEKMETAVNKVIKMGGEDAIVEKARKLAGSYFLTLCGEAIEAENFREAAMMSKKSIDYYNLNTTAYYYQALSNNNIGNFDQAIQAVIVGKKVEEGDESNLNFELGRAYEGKDDKVKACEAYRNVTSGPNVDAANYQVSTVLQCD